MKKSRHLLNIKKPEQLKQANDTENIPKLRASSRLTKTVSKFPLKADYFQIRKPLNIYMIEKLHKLGRKTYFQRVFILALNIEEVKFKEYCHNADQTFSDFLQPDFREYVQHYLDEIFASCEKKKSTADHLSGLFISMGNSHSILMIEGAEDMIATFFEELDLIHDRIWISSKVFLVEDKIDETYFNCFYSRRSPAINTNEKFSPSIPNDYKLMAVQHLKIKEKIKNLVATLSTELRKESAPDLTKDSEDSPADMFVLPDDPFNKWLPEIQRISLVLSANKFYRNVKDFAKTYRFLQFHQDEDSFLWPIQNNYTPLNIFKRSEFDVNLTFGRGGKEETMHQKEKQENVSHDSEDLAQNA